jgi:hypothetical protein
MSGRSEQQELHKPVFNEEGLIVGEACLILFYLRMTDANYSQTQELCITREFTSRSVCLELQ